MSLDSDLNVRPASGEDAATMAELNRVLGYPVEHEVFRQRLEQLLARPDHAAFVAEIAPNLVIGGSKAKNARFWRSVEFAKSLDW